MSYLVLTKNIFIDRSYTKTYQINGNDILIADTYQYHIKLLNTNYFYNKFITDK